MQVTSELTITESQEQARVPITVFALAGRLNLSNSEQLERKAQESYQHGTRFLLLDLAGVPSITSAGLRAIHLIYRMLHPAASAPTHNTGADRGNKSPHLKVFTPHAQVRTVLQTAGFDTYIDVVDRRDAALQAF